ncbi:MAG: hypothetical protein JO100_12335 [Pseudonocardia sp.]|nr:hypothetical protein [Pseudonocardia sp.]
MIRDTPRVRRLRASSWAMCRAPSADASGARADRQARAQPDTLVEVLNAIYEVDFLGFSYGFRPRRRSPVR